jgi:hypothetical protein
MNKRLEKSSQQALDSLKEEVQWSENHVRTLQALLPKESARDQLKGVEVPALEKQLAEEESKLDAASKDAERVCLFLFKNESGAKRCLRVRRLNGSRPSDPNSGIFNLLNRKHLLSRGLRMRWRGFRRRLKTSS